MHYAANSVKKTAQRLGLSERKVYQLIATRELSSIKIGRSRRVTDRQIEIFLSKCEAASELSAA